MVLKKILDLKKTKLDKNGIWTTNITSSNEVKSSRKTWERIYDYNASKLKKDREDFKKNKLNDHMGYISKAHKFTPSTVYLEIGCGPAYIGEHLMSKYNCGFVGIDFNYQMLVVLKKYLEGKKYKKFILIHADRNKMPLKSNSIDFIYGGGVIEHFKRTDSILKELYRVLKRGGAVFNTVPAFNFFWPMSMKKNIPSYLVLKQIFEFLHINLLKNRLLDKYHGYELSFGLTQLKKVHEKIGFSSSDAGAFAFHPSSGKLRNRFLRETYFNLSKHSLISPVVYIAAKK